MSKYLRNIHAILYMSTIYKHKSEKSSISLIYKNLLSYTVQQYETISQINIINDIIKIYIILNLSEYFIYIY